MVTNHGLNRGYFPVETWSFVQDESGLEASSGGSLSLADTSVQGLAQSGNGWVDPWVNGEKEMDFRISININIYIYIYITYIYIY